MNAGSLFLRIGAKVETKQFAEATARIKAMASLARQQSRAYAQAAREASRAATEQARALGMTQRAEMRAARDRSRNERAEMRVARDRAREATRAASHQARETTRAANQQVRETTRVANHQAREVLRADRANARADRARRNNGPLARMRAEAAGGRSGGGGGGTGGALSAVSGVRRLLYGAGVFAGAKEIVSLADTYTNLHSRLKLLTKGSMPEANALFEKTSGIATRTRSDLESTTEGFVRIAKATQEMGLSTNDALLVTERINKTLKMSGASSSEARAGMMQLTQALAKGKLDGDEFKSLGENLPSMLDVLKKKLGVTEGQLRKLSRQGKLTTKVIVEAFKEAGYIDEDFKNTLPTIGEQFVLLKNDMIKTFGEFAKDVNLVDLMRDALMILGAAIKIIVMVLKPIIQATAAFVQGLKDGKPWAIALALVLSTLLIPQLIAMTTWLIGIPRMLRTLALFKFTEILMGIEKVTNGLKTMMALKMLPGGGGGGGGAAAGTTAARAASTGLGAAGGIATAAAIGAYATGLEAVDFGTSLGKKYGKNEALSRFSNPINMLGEAGTLGESLWGKDKPKDSMLLDFLGLSNINSAIPRSGSAEGAGASGAPFTQNNTININGVQGADQAVDSITGAAGDVMDRRMRHAYAGAGG